MKWILYPLVSIISAFSKTEWLWVAEKMHYGYYNSEHLIWIDQSCSGMSFMGLAILSTGILLLQHPFHKSSPLAQVLTIGLILFFSYLLNTARVLTSVLFDDSIAQKFHLPIELTHSIVGNVFFIGGILILLTSIILYTQKKPINV